MSDKRYIFGHPIREETTAVFHPDKMTVDEFVDLIKGSMDEFAKNMKGIRKDALEFPEEWLETMAAWMEIEPLWTDVQAVKELVYKEKS
jgi:hypothetical protein